MEEQATPIRGIREDVDRAVNDMRSEVDRLAESFDFSEIGERIERMGRQQPMALAIGALTIGVAAGFMMRKGLKRSSVSKTTPAVAAS